MASIPDFARRIRSLMDQGRVEPVTLNHLAFDALILASEAVLSSLDVQSDALGCDQRALPAEVDEFIKVLSLRFGNPQSHVTTPLSPAESYFADADCIRSQLTVLSHLLSRKRRGRGRQATISSLRLLSLSIRGLQAKYSFDLESNA